MQVILKHPGPTIKEIDLTETEFNRFPRGISVFFVKRKSSAPIRFGDKVEIGKQ